ncbi:MAG: DUF2067 family protein [Thermoprotei archaeon]|nr:DUF2067 family protein [Thermoprotei archaeon]
MAFKRVVRIIKIPPKARSNPTEFLEKLTEALRTPSTSICLKGDTIRVEVAGPPRTVYETLGNITSLLEEYSEQPGGSLKKYTYEAVERLAGVGVPVELLGEYLRLKGYRAARKTKKSIETSAPKDVVVDAARRIGDSLVKAGSVKLSNTAFKMVVVASAMLGLEPSLVVERGLKEGVLEASAAGSIRVSHFWRKSLTDFLEALKEAPG